MKSKNKTMSKKGKIFAIIFAILLACCITVSGIMLFRPNETAPSVTNAASATPSVVTVTADKTELKAGDEITFTFVLSTTRTGQDWNSAQVLLMPMVNGSPDYELGNKLSQVRVRRPGYFDENFDNFTCATTVKLDHSRFAEDTGILLTLTFTDTDYDASNAATYQATLKLADDYTDSVNFTFGFVGALDFITTVPNGMSNPKTKDTAANGNLSIVGPTFKVGDGSGVVTPPTPVQPTLTQLELSSASATAGFSTVTAGGSVTWKIADHALNSLVYFRAAVPTGATASASTGLSATATANVFSGTLAYGTNTFKVKVQGTSESREYTYTIKLLEQVNTISGITASPALTGFTFNAATSAYNVQVENSVSSLTLTVTVDGDYETLSTSGRTPVSNSHAGRDYTLQYSLSVGLNAITLYGVSDIPQDGTAYTLNVTRKNDGGTTPAPSDDSTLSGITVTSGGKPAALSPSFKPDKTDGYTITVDDIDDVIGVTPTTSDPNADATYEITPNGDGTKTITVTVEAEDHSTKEYTVIVKEKTPVPPPVSLGDAVLDAIYINKISGDYARGDLISGFDPAVTDYKVFIPSTCDQVRLTAVAHESNANVIMYVDGVEADKENLGAAMDFVYLPDIGGSVEVEFVVSTNDDTRTYTVVVTRSTQAPYLRYLTVGSYQIYDANGKAINGKDENSVRDVKDFFVTIENADTVVNIVAYASPENATVLLQNRGIFTVAELFNGKATVDLPFSVVILDDDNTPISETIHYTLHLTRKPALTSDINARIIIDEITKAHNAVIFNDEYAQDWNTDRIVYGANEPYYRVPYNVSALTVHVYPEAIGELIAPPTYQIFYGDVLKSDNGAENTSLRLNYTFNVVTIVITSSDLSTSKTIVVIVYREEPSLRLNPMIVEIPDFKNEYQPEVTDYAYTVGHDITGLTVQVDWDTAMYTCVIEGADSLKVGHNIVTICLYEKASGIGNAAASADKSNAVRTITLDVFRESNGPSTIWLILFIVFLLLAILEFLILLLLLSRNRKETEKITERVVVQSAPAPVVRHQMAAPPVSPVQYVTVPQPQVQYVAMPQPVEAEKSQQPVNVEVKITGCGDSDGHYKTKK